MHICWDEFAWLRIANIIVAIGAMGAMGIAFAYKHKITPRRTRRQAAAIYLLLIAIAYGSGRAANLGAPVREHVMFMFGALLCVVLSFLPMKGDDTLPGDHDMALYARAYRAARYYWLHRHDWRGTN